MRLKATGNLRVVKEQSLSWMPEKVVNVRSVCYTCIVVLTVYQDGGGRATSDSSDQEDMDCRESRDGLSSPSHHSYMEDVDNGEKLDSDEDDDLKGKDAAAIQGVFNQEVRPVTAFLLDAI